MSKSKTLQWVKGISILNLKAAASVAYPDTDREALHAIHIECIRQGEVVIVSTDGKTMLVQRTPAEVPEDSVGATLTIPINGLSSFWEVLQGRRNWLDKSRPAKVNLEVDGVRCNLTIPHVVTVISHFIRDDYPKTWKALIPKESAALSRADAHRLFVVDPERMARLLQMFGELSGNHPKTAPNPMCAVYCSEEPQKHAPLILADHTGHYIGILMPCAHQAKEGDPMAPQWKQPQWLQAS